MVKTYRKKPVEVQAEQFLPDEGVWPTGVMWNSRSPTGYDIDTLEGRMEVTPGDFIITGVKGERYPCKPDIFEMTYEEVS
jgi:hypothetical protein